MLKFLCSFDIHFWGILPPSLCLVLLIIISIYTLYHSFLPSELNYMGSLFFDFCILDRFWIACGVFLRKTVFKLPCSPMPAGISPGHGSLFFDACWDQPPRAWCPRSVMLTGIRPEYGSLFLDGSWDQSRTWCTHSAIPARVTHPPPPPTPPPPPPPPGGGRVSPPPHPRGGGASWNDGGGGGGGGSPAR